MRKRWTLILLCLVIGIVASIGYILSTTSQYEANTQLFISVTDNASSGTNQANGQLFAQARVQSYVGVSTSEIVASRVVKDLGLKITPKQLAGKVSADAPLNKVLLNIHVKDHDPQLAFRIANSTATQLKQVINELEIGDAKASPVTATIIEPATVPNSPVAPRKRLIVTIGFLAGLVGGLLLAFARERLDTRLRITEDLQRVTDAPILGVIPSDKRAASHPIAFRDDPRGRRSEAFRQLRANLQFVDVDTPPKTIAVTSAVASEGKTSVSLNLATTLAEAGIAVCVVETDLRRPTIANTLGLAAGAGLTSVLVGRADIDDVLQDLGNGLSVITSGPMPPNPSELLASQQLRLMLADLSARFEYVILDTAPLLPVADGVEVVSIADATILVLRSGKSNEDRLAKSVDAVQRVGGVVAGLVLNQAPRQGNKREYEYYQYTKSDPGPANSLAALSNKS